MNILILLTYPWAWNSLSEYEQNSNVRMKDLADRISTEWSSLTSPVVSYADIIDTAHLVIGWEGHFTLVLYFLKSSDPRLNIRKIWDTSWLKDTAKSWTGSLQNCQGHKRQRTIDKLSQSQETRKTQMTKQCIILNWFLGTDKKHTVGVKKKENC